MTDPIPVPEQAVTAARDALHRRGLGLNIAASYARTALEAAAPAIRQAERQRIAGEVSPQALRLIADGIEREDRLHRNEPAVLLPGGTVTGWLRRAADLLDDRSTSADGGR